jgi:hypothetical protein
LRIDYAPLKAAALFLEGGYTLRRIGRIHGEAAYITNTRDNNEDGFRSEYTWEDDWVLATDNTGRLPLVRYDGLSAVSIDDFTLDLSAFYLRAGIRLALF